MKSAQIENPNNFLSENVSPSKDVNNSESMKTSEIINPITEMSIINTPFTTNENAKTFSNRIIKKILTILKIEKIKSVVYDESW